MNSEINYVSPFKKFCITIGNLPTSYLESMSYYESLTYLVNYLTNNVIPALNHNGEVVEEVQAKFVELKNYVDNYFVNLDVQEEINNKLDEMVEDGTLYDLIKKYLSTKPAIFGFNNVSQMKLSQDLSNGNIAKTLGYHNINDGGEAEYIIREKTNEDVIDEMFIIELYDNDLVAELKIPNQIKPTILGAIGDGTTDELNILKTALKYCIDNEKQLYIDKTYYISDTLLDDNDYDTSAESEYVKLNIKGNNPNKNHIYTNDGYGCIKIANGKDVFKNIKFRGSISNLSFVTVSRNTAGSIFNNCDLNYFEFNNNNVSNIGSFLTDTNISGTSLIKDNQFLTVYCFAKHNLKNCYCNDSTIQNNYINGGAELNNNTCFEFMNYNGATICNNFIDYYRTIYEPKSTNLTSFEGVTSIGNQYQVFRYLYYKNSNISSFTFTSVGDTFNWTNPSSLTKLSNYEAIKYTGHDSVEYDLPPYVMMIDSTLKIKFTNAYLQSNLGNIVFIKKSLGDYAYAEASLNFISQSITKYGSSYVTVASGGVFSGGDNKNNLIDIPFIHTLDTLPSTIDGWSQYYLGQRIMVNNKLYRRVWDLDQNRLSWLEYKF